MFLDKLKELTTSEQSKYKIGELLDMFESSSIIVCLVLVTIVTSLPLPPWGGGFETIPGGILSLFLAIQGLLGLDQVYLPSFAKQLDIDLGFLKTSDWTKKIIYWLEKYIKKDRAEWALNPIFEKLMYILIIPNALLMIVPIVFTNGPPSQCITAMAITWLLYDGLLFGSTLGVSIFVIVMYTVLFIVFAKLLYRTRKTWTFGLWK
jgi:hypothetical protein